MKLKYLILPLMSVTLLAQTAPATSNLQQVLDLLAQPLSPNSFQPALPASFALWTDEQKATVPRQVAGRCAVGWVIMNSGETPVPLLPAAEEKEAPALAAAVCVAGKMPHDWPGRAQNIMKAKDILNRAKASGSILHLPQSLND